MNKEEFIDSLKELGIESDDQKLKQLDKYYKLLVETNEKMNLTTITEYEDVYLKHFYDSLTIVKAIDLKEYNSFCDIGTGAGFPGIVIKIFYPELEVVLIESLQKRVEFLKEVVKELNLSKIEVINARAEEYAVNNRDKYDIVTARAVANINILLEYCIPLVRIGGCFVAMKGNVEEISNNALNCLKISKPKQLSFTLPNGAGNRNLYTFSKNQPTPQKFPRKYNEIKKRTL